MSEGIASGARDPAEVFVGRERELGLLRAAVEGAASGVPSVVVVVGEAGIGKTTLVHRALRSVDAEVVLVSGDESETALDLGLLDQLLLRLPRPGGDVGASDHDRDAGPSVDTLHAGQALLRRLDGRPADRPLVVVLDDAHLGDAPSLEAITFVARRLLADAVAVVVTSRTAGLDALPPGLVRLARSTGGVVDLAPLTVEAVGELIEAVHGTAAPGRAAERLHTHSAGNPLHATVLLDQVDLAALTGTEDLPTPRSFRSLVLGQLAACGGPARHLAAALTVLDLPARGVDAVAVADLGHAPDAVADAWDQLVRHGIALRVGDPEAGLVDLGHDLVRASVRDDLSETRRMALHRRAAEVVGGERALRHRLAASAGPDASLADEAEAAADDALARGARGAAAELLLAAAGVAPTPAEHARLVLLAAEESMVAGRPLGPWARSIRSFDDSPRKGFVEGLLQMAAGQFSEARPLLQAAWAAADAEGSVALAGAAAEQLSIIAVGTLSSPDVLRWSQRAVAAGVGTMSATLLAHGWALAGDLDRAREEMTRLIGTGAGDGDASIDARLGRGVVEVWANDLEAARADLEQVVAHTRDRGALRHMNALGYLAEARLRMGDVAEAVDLAERCVSVLDDLGVVWFTPMPHSVAAFALAVQGDLDRARLHATAAAQLGEASGQVPARIWSTHAALRIAVADQDHPAVAAIGDRMLADGWDVLPEGVHHWTAAYADALVAAGRLADAEVAVARVEHQAAVHRDGSVGAEAARARGGLTLARGDAEGADRAFDGALAADAHLARPFERARLELAAGAHRRRAGRRTEAAALLQAAARRFSDMGSTVWSDRCERELVACGLRPVKRSDPGAAAALTPQEREVARAVAAGHTNREIGAELAISAKTVEHHLSRVYAKLGIRGRMQVAAALAPPPEA